MTKLHSSMLQPLNALRAFVFSGCLPFQDPVPEHFPEITGKKWYKLMHIRLANINHNALLLSFEKYLSKLIFTNESN